MKEKGITLIALVVTIIILLILAGVSIGMLTGDNGIITQSQNAKEETEIGYEREQVNLAYISAKTNEITNGENGEVDADDMNRELQKQRADATASGQHPITVVFNESGRMYEIDGDIQITEVPMQDMSSIFTYNASTGYITGIKDEYLTTELSENNDNSVKVATTNDGINIAALSSGYYLIEEVGTYLNIPEEIDGTTIVGIEMAAFGEIMNIENVRIPNTVKSIGNYAFFRCSALKNITIPNSVDTIGDQVFTNCINLRNITIPSSVQTMGANVFEGTSVTVKVPFKEGEKPDGWNENWSDDYSGGTISIVYQQ